MLHCLSRSQLYQVLGDGADSRTLSEIVAQVLTGGTGVGETHWEG